MIYICDQDINLISCQLSLSTNPENIRKPEGLWCFQRVYKETSCMKWINLSREDNQTSTSVMCFKANLITIKEQGKNVILEDKDCLFVVLELEPSSH